MAQRCSGPLGDPYAVGALDETSEPSRGTQSAGVARQYGGTLKQVANCQVAVFLSSVSSQYTRACSLAERSPSSPCPRSTIWSSPCLFWMLIFDRRDHVSTGFSTRCPPVFRSVG